MNSAQEKANGLVETYMWQVIPPVEKSQAVQYSILAVDEILELYEQDIYYWQEVKQHLEEML